MNQPMHKKQKKPVNWGVFNDKELAEAIKNAEEGDGSGASTWNDVSGKPFETIGDGLDVAEGVLSATGGAGGADWNAASGEAGFIDNKPFDVTSENTYTVYADMSEPTPVEANKLGYFDTLTQSIGHTVYAGVVPVGSETDLPTFNVGDKFKITYDNVVYEDTITVITDGFPTSTTNFEELSGGTFEQPLFVGLLAMGGWAVLIVDDTLPTTADSTIDVSDYLLTGKTKLGAGKIKLGLGLYVDEDDSISARITNGDIDSQTNLSGYVLTADGDGSADWLPIAFPDCPTTTDGTYKLQAVVSNGSVTYSWVSST